MKLKLIHMMALLLCVVLVFTACSGETTDDAAQSENGTHEQGSDGGTTSGAFVWDDNLPIQTDSTTFPMTVRDFIGNETVLTEAPKRVAVLSGAPLNIWYDLGGKAVCTSTISNNLKVVEEYADEIKALPSIGKVNAVNLEAIVEYEPDLVIAQENVQSETIDLLQGWGYKVITTYLRDYEDVVATYRAFGTILGAGELAETKVADLGARYQALLDKKPAEAKTVVILYLTSKKLQVKLGGSIAGIIADDLGLVNIASGLSPIEEGSENATLDIEYLVEHQPDMILVTSMISSNEEAKNTMQEHLTTNDAWKGIAAAQNGNIVYLPQEYFLYNAGPYFDEALRYMACGVYPEIYGTIDSWYVAQQ